MADGNIQLELVTPARRVLTQAVVEVRAPGADGSFGVRPGHTPFVARMKAGALVATTAQGTLAYAVGEGFVQVAQDRVLVLAETAERADEIDLAAAKADVEAETKKLGGLKESDADYELQRAKVERAAARVLVATRL